MGSAKKREPKKKESVLDQVEDLKEDLTLTSEPKLTSHPTLTSKPVDKENSSATMSQANVKEEDSCSEKKGHQERASKEKG